MTKQERVAVLLATYNGAKYLTDFLDSLKNQSHKNFVLFVRDDGSTDGTLDIVRKYCDEMNIKIVPSDVRLGAAQSFMALLETAGVDFSYYSFADQDDFWIETKLERGIDKISTINRSPALYCSRLEYVDKSLQHIKFSRIPRVVSFENALVENISTGCTILLNQSARALLLSSPPRFYTMHDWWMYLVVSSFGRIVYDDCPTIKYRQHEDNAIGAATNLFQEYYRKIIRFVEREKAKGVFGVFAQTNEFKRCYASRLQAMEVEKLNRIIIGKTKLLERLRLCLFSPFVRQKRLDTLILRILFLINRY
jgi:glycosyltransferase involved in cell wall biosynthesis